MIKNNSPDATTSSKILWTLDCWQIRGLAQGRVIWVSSFTSVLCLASHNRLVSKKGHWARWISWGPLTIKKWVFLKVPISHLCQSCPLHTVIKKKTQRITSGSRQGSESCWRKRPVILHKLWMFTTEKHECHPENQKDYALGSSQELSQVILKMLHFKNNFSFKKMCCFL